MDGAFGMVIVGFYFHPLFVDPVCLYVVMCPSDVRDLLVEKVWKVV